MMSDVTPKSGTPEPSPCSTGKRLFELDILRGFSMLAVVAIHVSNLPLANLAVGRWRFAFYTFYSLLSFAVPSFIFVSALLAAYNEAEHPVKISSYYKKKLFRLVLPYLAWSLLYIVFNLAVREMEFSEVLSLSNWFYWILQGNAHWHLYFLVIIIQFHLLFPLFLKLARLVKDKPLFALLFVIVGQNIVYWLNKLWLYKSFPYFHSSVLWYFAICFSGVYIGINYDKFCSLLHKYTRWLAALCPVSAAAYAYCHYLLYYRISYHSFSYHFIELIYFLSLSLFLFAPARSCRISHSPAGRWLTWVGIYSMGIYLLHPVINYYLNTRVKTGNPVALMFICIAAVLAYTVVCGFISKFLESFRPTAWLFGVKKETSGGIRACHQKRPEP